MSKSPAEVMRSAEREIEKIERLFADTERRLTSLARRGELDRYISGVGPRWHSKYRDGVFGRRLARAREKLNQAAKALAAGGDR